MRGGGEEVAVVTVDFFQAGVGGAGEVEGVGGAEEDSGWECGDANTRVVDQVVIDGQPDDEPGGFVRCELSHRLAEAAGIDALFTLMTLQPGNHFKSPVPRADEIAATGHPCGDFGRTLLLRIDLKQVRCVQIVHVGG